MAFRPATLLKRGSNTGVFLWLLWSFCKHLFWKTSADIFDLKTFFLSYHNLKPIYRNNAQFLWCARKWFPCFLRWLRTIVKHFWSHRENRFHLYFWHEWGRLSTILAHLKLLQWMLTSSGGFTMWFRIELIIRDFYYGINNSLRLSRTFSIHVDIVTVVIKSCL